MDQDERDLLARIVTQIDHCSEYQHRLARRQAVLRDAATMLRLGRSAPAVLAAVQEQIPEAVVTLGSAAEEDD